MNTEYIKRDVSLSNKRQSKAVSIEQTEVEFFADPNYCLCVSHLGRGAAT